MIYTSSSSSSSRTRTTTTKPSITSTKTSKTSAQSISKTPSPPAPPFKPCKIYIIDPSKELAPDLGVSECRIEEAWPFNSPGNGVDGLNPTPHDAARHAFGYWVAEAIRNSPYHTENIDDADLWYVDTHCYALWHESLWHMAQKKGTEFSPFNDVSNSISRLIVEGVMQHKYFTKTAGRRFIISRPTSGTPPGGIMDTCARLKRSFLLASERAVFCDNDRNRALHGESLILPLVVTQHVNLSSSAAVAADERSGGSSTITATSSTSTTSRSTFLYFNSRCPVDVATRRFLIIGRGGADEQLEELKHGASLAGEPSRLGQYFLAGMLSELGSAGGDVLVSCLHKTYPSQEEIMSGMKRSIFCPIMASGSQATRLLPAAAFSGCIPVFFGPPWAAIPLAHDIDYPAFSFFFNVTDSGHHEPELSPEEALKPRPPGDLELIPEIESEVIQVATFKAALKYLRSVPEERVGEMQGALETERLKLYYPPAPGQERSVAGDVIVHRMCEYANKLTATLETQKAERIQRGDVLPKD